MYVLHLPMYFFLKQDTTNIKLQNVINVHFISLYATHNYFTYYLFNNAAWRFIRSINIIYWQLNYLEKLLKRMFCATIIVVFKWFHINSCFCIKRNFIILTFKILAIYVFHTYLYINIYSYIFIQILSTEGKLDWRIPEFFLIFK